MYFEHELTVKIMDNILSKSNQWAWFIDYVEKQEVDFTVSDFQDFFNKHFEINDLFIYLTKIREYYYEDLGITASWLKDLDNLALFYNGNISLDDFICQNDFFQIFKMLIYCGKIYSVGKSEKYLMYQDIFLLRNIFQKESINVFYDEKETIYRLIDKIEIDMNEPLSVFNDNINYIFAENKNFVAEHYDELYNANCFSYHFKPLSKYNTWQERYINEMISTKYESGKLKAHSSIGEKDFPDFSLWNSEILHNMKAYFKNEVTDFIIESIEYALHKAIPSQSTIEIHFRLLFEYYQNLKSDKERDYYCSSLEFIISFLNDSKVQSIISKECYINLSKAIEYVNANNVLLYFDKKGILRNKNKKEDINKIINEKLFKINKINDFVSFTQYIEDEYILHKIDKSIADVIYDKFDSVLEKCEYNLLPSLFLQYFQFLTRIINNKNIVANEIRYEIIRVRCLWTDEYYRKSVGVLTSFKQKMTVSDKAIKKHNDQIIDKPIGFAANIFNLSKDKMIEGMQTISNNPFSALCLNIIVAEDFPKPDDLILDNDHNVDKIYEEIIRKIIGDNYHKFLNVFSSDVYLKSIYRTSKALLRAEIYFFTNHEIIYKNIKDKNSEYNLLSFSSNPTLAHLTQLFPLLENRIRDYGEICGIVPVNIKSGNCNKLKSPTSVLTEIITNIYKVTDDLINASDFFFIYFCMYGENGLNIRNECIHGKNYIKSNEIDFAFKITLLCLHMIDNRFNMLIRNYN